MIDKDTLQHPFSSIYYDWFEGIVYNQIAEYLKDKDIKTCVDIGASNGVVTQWLLEKLSPEKVLCFEPDENNFESLYDNFKDSDKVQIYNIGIYYGLEESQVYGNGDNNSLGFMIGEIKSEHYEFWKGNIIPYESKFFRLGELEAFLDFADLIKIDVEGAEYNLIENSKIIKETKFLLLETHNHTRNYVEDYLKINLQNHVIVFTQGAGIHLGYLLERKDNDK